MANVLLFGATSAIAAECAKQFVARGDSVCLVGRDKAKLERLKQDLQVRASSDAQKVLVELCDLADPTQHERLLSASLERLQSIDIMLIAHGSLPNQRRCEESVEETLKEINLNGISAISLLTIGANYFESQGSGVLVAISSVAGDRGRQSNYVYGSAKGMLTIFMQGLRNRLAKTGVQVLTVKPGFVDTPMTQSFDKNGPLWAQPEQIASGILKAIDKGRNEVYLLWFWRWIMLIIKAIPEFIFKKLSL
ncbi:SDR family oxidoreductase [Marinomonas gallaica]|uniref:SDR family oxidoreductase n=1 Tax=Marinomonas gallaica TaxID=1806667 RepID=UPI003A8FFCF4